MLRWLTHVGTGFGRLLATIPVPTFLRGIVWAAIGRLLGASLEESGAPLKTYKNFQAFFTRTLKPGVHSIAAGATWTSPADSFWLSHVRIEGDIVVPAKNNRHSLGELLADLGPTATQPWQDGMVSTFYLRPKDYHRVHAPCDMTVEAIVRVPGLLLPVNDFGQRVPGLFARNERVILKASAGDRQVFFVFVGAFMVGSVRLSHAGLAELEAGGAPVQVAKGAELGMFEFGSTVIVVCDAWAGDATLAAREVRVGDALFSFA